MDLIFLIGTVQAFFFATLLYSRKKILHSHKVLILFFIVNGLILLDHFLELKGTIFKHPHLLGLTYTLPIALGPILFYYTRVMTEEKKPSDRILLHFLPFALLTLYFVFDYYFLSASEKLAYYYRESEGKTSIMVYITEFFLNFSVPFYAILSIVALNRHLKSIKSKFSYMEKINLKWLSVILTFFIAISVIILITNLLTDIIPVFSFMIGDSLIYGGVVIAIFFIGYYGIKQKAIYPEEGIFNVSKKGKYQRSGLVITENDPTLKRLLSVMETEKLYRNNRLSLQDLAERLGLTENKTSQLINEGLGKNFYDFVNEYRVKEVKLMIRKGEHDHLSLLGIALDCGFNSKSSFNSIFKQHTGQTPSEYKKSII